MILSLPRQLHSYLFSSRNKVQNTSNPKSLWQERFTLLISKPKSANSLWDESACLSRSISFTPEASQLHHIQVSLAHLPRNCLNTPSITTTQTKTDFIAVRLFTKIWHNTLRLFTRNSMAKEVENRHFFNINEASIKIFDIARSIGFIAINKYTIELIVAAIGISTSLAYIVTIACVVTVIAAAVFFINRYAERVLVKPLDPGPNFDNLTKRMAESIPMSENGRYAELDKLETALFSPGAEVGITGNKGCGKSELIKLLAQRIAHGNCSNHLKEKQVYYINGADLKSGYLNKLREDIKGREEDVILCIDEAHAIFPSCSQTLKTFCAGSAKPRIIYVTTELEFIKTFAAEEDGSWLSRINPILELTAINRDDLRTILRDKLQNRLPWIDVSLDLVEPFADIAKEDLRTAVKYLDFFAAQFLKTINSSETLSAAIERKANLEARLSEISSTQKFSEWIGGAAGYEISREISEVEKTIAEERTKLEQRKERQKKYEEIHLLQKKWQSKIYSYSRESQKVSKQEKEKHLFASCLWASEVFESKKRELSHGLTTSINLKEIQDSIENQSASRARIAREGKKQIKGTTARTKGAKEQRGDIDAASGGTGSDPDEAVF